MKNLFSKFIKNLFVKSRGFSLGAYKNEPDNRDIPYTLVASTAQPLSPHIEVPKFLTTKRLEQGQLGTCVEHAFEFIARVEDGVLHSRRVPYVITRNYLNWTELQGQGLPQREAAKVSTTVGTPKDSGLDNNNLSHKDYTALAITPAMIKEANIYRFGGFAFPSISVNGIKQALADGKLVAITVAIDWSEIESDGTIHPAKNISGFHEIVIGMSDDPTKRFRFANWWGPYWGTNGDGFIEYGELEHVVYDAIAFVDIPEDLKERAKLIPYVFNADLSFGSNSAANIQLQRRLRDYGLFTAIEDRRFGLKTLAAVKDYQKIKGIQQTGYVGAITRKALNEDAGLVKSRLDLWIEATTRMEGANPANHNPGNLRYVGQKEAVGVTKNGFCIFPDDATGYNMLRNMFIRCASGGSKLYNMNGSLYDFYNVYAPSSDNNDPKHYAEVVAKHIGVDPHVAIKNLLI